MSQIHFNPEDFNRRAKEVRETLKKKFPEHVDEISKMPVTAGEGFKVKIPKSKISPELYSKIETDKEVRGLLLPLQ